MTERTPIDWKKPLRTSDGKGEVTIYCEDAPGEYPAHGRIDFESGNTRLLEWLLDGSFRSSVTHAFDLLNVAEEPKPFEFWAAIIEKKDGSLGAMVALQKELSLARAATSRSVELLGAKVIGNKRITITEPEGFDE